MILALTNESGTFSYDETTAAVLSSRVFCSSGQLPSISNVAHLVQNLNWFSGLPGDCYLLVTVTLIFAFTLEHTGHRSGPPDEQSLSTHKTRPSIAMDGLVRRYWVANGENRVYNKLDGPT